ncbi:MULTISPECIES: DNA-binding domain-containing protein [unclassified Treponema]|uniref:DNA-binding domain-containing protein n=1 Tax=unclassified Treponema TaxID=2638727 RepID=UPI0025D83F8E|nr:MULTISPECIES: DNA-binding domain-containing protein [unclassified Treponema]
MLNIKTIKNSLISDESKDGFCFRSSCSQTLSQEKLAAEMADWNSSFTEADYLGMLSVMEKIVVKYISKGYNVELPFGSLRANATGTCANIQDGFAPGTGNHALGLLFTASAAAFSQIKSKLEYRQLPPDVSGEAKIYRVTVLQKDASESSILSAATGKTLRLHGRNLSFDIEDNAQGVFLENETGPVRMETYNRRGSNIVDIVVPSSLSAGSYSISVVTKPGSTYFTANIDSEIMVA